MEAEVREVHKSWKGFATFSEPVVSRCSTKTLSLKKVTKSTTKTLFLKKLQN